MHQITEEQRKRSELNRLAALAKRLDRGGSDHDPWKLFKCRKVLPEPNSTSTFTGPFKYPPRPDLSGQITKVPVQLPDRFRVRLEICSPDSFSITPVAIEDFPFPGEAKCLEIIEECLSAIMQSHYTQNTGGGKACVYKLREYEAVLRCFKLKRIQCEEIPWLTLNVVVKLSDSFNSGRWIPCRPEHLSDEKVDELLGRLPKSLVDILLPFQHEGVRFGLRRGGRCLIADEMGLGKTLQAIAIAGCFLNEGPVLVVCPAILRYAWAEEFEHWLPSCLPCDIHLVFGHQNNPARLVKCPKVVITSYTMLNRLRKSMSQQDWAVLIVDESHHVRCSKQISESDEIKAVLDVARTAKHTVLLSGTPSLSRLPYDIFHQIDMLWPGLLGKDKYEFAKNYCSVKSVHGIQGKVYKDYSRGVRLEELNVLLKQSVMIRRLKEDVLMQLPPKRRQIISLVLKRSDFNFAGGVPEVVEDASTNKNTEDETLDIADEPNNVKSAVDADCCKFSMKITDQELAMAKLSGFREWLSFHPIIAELSADEDTERNSSSHKMIIFGHHHKVLDAVQEFICEKGIEFVRIDGNTHERDRQLYVQSFQSSKQVKIALIGILAGGTGLNLSAAHNVVFLELPKEPSHLLQAEDRAHRRGQTKAVNIYIFCAKDTSDESRWQKLNKSLHRVSSTVNGKYDAIKEIEIDSVVHLGGTREIYIEENELPPISSATEHSVVDLMEFPTSIDQNLHCDQASGEVDENKRADKENYSGRNSPQKAANFHLNEGSEGNAPETEKEICTRLSIHSEIDVKEDNGITDRANNQFHEIAMQDNREPAEIVEAASLIDSLRFEVSQYSGRIHLYTCNPGVDSRPRPLFENFRPEELESQLPSANCSQRLAYSCIKDNPKYRHIILEFIEEWNKLRPIEQKKLLAKPLQLPLSVELYCLNNSINHDFGGLLKGKSKKRTTSLHEISYPLPSDAVWRKISLCSGRGKKEKVYEQGWTLSDEPLCKLCQTPCNCYEEFRLRTSNRSLREGLFQIEHGICTSCHLDCHKLVEHTKRLPLQKRESYIGKVAPDLANRPKLLEKLVREPSEGNAWHADHIVPVYLGGGECKLENMRTLCVVCHARVTKEQCAERRSTRLKAKKQLKALMNDLGNVQNLKQNYSEEKSIHTEVGSLWKLYAPSKLYSHKHTPDAPTTLDDILFEFKSIVITGFDYAEESKQMMTDDDAVEDDLLIEVPGSAYRNICTGSEEHERNFSSTVSEHLDDAFTGAKNISSGVEEHEKVSNSTEFVQ
ncbi:hypothetical protein OROGR_021298 [Orobanche gracilis]